MDTFVRGPSPQRRRKTESDKDREFLKKQREYGRFVKEFTKSARPRPTVRV